MTPTPTPEPTETPTPHEHSYTETIVTEALCNTTGVKQYSCSCGDSYNEEYIDSHNHQGDGNPRVLKESDCENRGVLLDETTEKPEGVEIRDFYPRPID